MGNSHHKTIFKWSSIEEQHTFSWNKFIAVERRRRRRQDLVNCCRQTTAFLFSHVGLSAMIVAYTVMGGFLFRALEGPFEKEEKNRVVEVKARLIGEILQAADSMDCFADNGRMLFVRSLFQASKPDRDVERFKGSISSNRSTPTDSFPYKDYHFPPRRPFGFSRRIHTRENRQSKSRHLNRSTFNSTLHQKFKTFALEILRAIKESGWNGQDDMEEASMQWSHAGAILYAITVITTIGYGHIAPKTDWGRIVTIIYALIGIPLTFLYLSNIGNFLADCFRIFYKRVCCDVFCCKKCERQRKRERLKLRKQRIQAIQRSLVMKAAMNTLMVDSGRTSGMPYDRLKSVVGFPTEDGYNSDEALRQWVARDNRRALSCEKRNCVGPQHYPLEANEYALSIYRKAFHSDSSLTSTGIESERRPQRKKVHRTNFKGVTIVEPRSPKKEIFSERPVIKQLDRSYVSYNPSQKESKYFRFASTNKDDSCDILSEGNVKFNRSRLDEAATNLWRIRRDSVFQSDSLLMASKQADNECSKSLKGSDKTGRALKKSLSVRFFHKSEKSQDIGNDTSRRKLRFPSRPFFKQTLKLSRKSPVSKPASSERNFFSWQKHKRKEDNEERAKENWQKLIAYSKQLSEENRRLTIEKQHTSNLYYNSLPLKAENLLRSRQLQNEETISKYQREESTQDAQRNGKTKESERRHDSNKKRTDLTSSLHSRDKVSKRSTPSRAKKEGELPLASTQKSKSKRQTSKSSPDKSNAAGQISTPGVKHIDSKNSIESYVTAICQSLSSIGEETTAATLTTDVRSSKRSKTRSCTDAREASKKGEKQKGADSNRKPKAGSTKKRKTFLKEKHSKKVIVQNAIGRSISNDNCSRLPRFHFQTTTSTLDQPQISYLGNSLPSPCALQETEEQAVDEDDDCSKVTVPIYICLILIGGYLFAGSALFSFWEGWNTITGSYFCFITLSTIGFGDIVPGTGVNDWASQAKLVLCTLWLALGLSLLAMCFNLMQEEVKERCRKLGVKLGLLKDDSKPMYE